MGTSVVPAGFPEHSQCCSRERQLGFIVAGETSASSRTVELCSVSVNLGAGSPEVAHRDVEGENALPVL